MADPFLDKEFDELLSQIAVAADEVQREDPKGDKARAFLTSMMPPDVVKTFARDDLDMFVTYMLIFLAGKEPSHFGLRESPWDIYGQRAFDEIANQWGRIRKSKAPPDTWWNLLLNEVKQQGALADEKKKKAYKSSNISFRKHPLEGYAGHYHSNAISHHAYMEAVKKVQEGHGNKNNAKK